MPMARKRDPVKFCGQCGKKMARKRYNGTLESNHAFRRRKYCNLQCAGASQMHEFPSIDAIRKRYAHLLGDTCERCGITENLDLHHIDNNPANNEPSNRMTLCDSCHTKWHWENGKNSSVKKSVCSVCGGPGKGLGLCLKHYQRQKKYGSPYLTKKRCGSHFVLADERHGPPDPANSTNGSRPESPQESKTAWPG